MVAQLQMLTRCCCLLWLALAGGAGCDEATLRADPGGADGGVLPGEGEGEGGIIEEEGEGGISEGEGEAGEGEGEGPPPPGCAVEVCDGLDNDCDGVADDRIICQCGLEDACYDGPPATRLVGECQDGSRICDVTGEFWQPCQGSRGPREEVCDDFLDNDCDGRVDNGCELTDCLPAEICDNGLDDDCDGLIDQGCSPCPPDETCGNGIDDDCDGVVDDGCPRECGPEELCGDGVDNDCDDQVDEDCALCDPDEICGDGVDNDCDGAIDEECGEVCRPQEICCNGRDDDCDGQQDEPDACEEVCDDRVDNDCDGQTDERPECVELCAPGLRRACYPGPVIEINVGICRAGIQQCDEQTGRWGECAGATLPQAEQCDDRIDNDCDAEIDEGCIVCLPEELCFDGIDNNCNTLIDEGCGNECRPGDVADCFPGPGQAGVGICRNGTRQCRGNGFWGPCNGYISAQEELCGNGVDEDCNGRIDNCVMNVSINIDGDCRTAVCPAQAPFPIGCNLRFDGGDCRGCVASDGGSTVYFQEGNVCGSGHVSGTLRCSTERGQGLNAANCPIAKPNPRYPGAAQWAWPRHGCPTEDDDNEGC